MPDSKNKKNTKNLIYLKWISFILLSALLYGLYSFFSFTVLNNEFSGPLALTLTLAVGQAILGIIIYFALTNKRFDYLLKDGFFKNHNKDLETIMKNPKDLLYASGAGISNIFGVFTLYSGYPLAPNPGLVDAVSNLYIIPQAILSRLIYNKTLSNFQIIGMIIGAIGIWFLTK